MIKSIGYATKASNEILKLFEFERNEPNKNEVQIEILFCGVCHSDIHQVKDEWGGTMYPCVPGHEIVGKVIKVGASVKKFKIGDLAGVGCMVGSCGQCDSCKSGLENYCERGFVGTYNGHLPDEKAGQHTYGGYSDTIVVREDFVLRIPSHMDPASAAPILCAGVTTFSPLRHWKVGHDSKVGIVGLGGLGHMAVKLALAMGAEVTVITTSAEKRDDAIKLGAHKVIISSSESDMKKNKSTLDFILSTIPQTHDANTYVELLRRDGVLTIVGCIAPLAKPVDMRGMVFARKSLAASLIGGISETQDVLDFCAQHNVLPNIKIIDINQVNEAFEQMNHSKTDFRYVIDMATLRDKKQFGFFENIGL